ncbi:exodeoxyribonuclease III [Parvularcula sp. IMCC14364]|uniref:exodeoxyribonuclease III n=1 Tax=Parvularcula sp. IMCC14364 TaxID=3067902 RepID=UPI00274268C1|nr:exodeoxyribonuclease III [Parvularcula sp. IMCC14364]
MKITTWNINSVRLRIGQVEKFLKEHAPDVLCLQEIKCVNDQFPSKALRKLGYEHIAVHGQPGYHGVAIISRHPFTAEQAHQFCGKDDTRHISVRLKGGLEIHNFYVPAGGDVPDPEVNEKFAHKLAFMQEMAGWFSENIARKSILVGDLNVAPTENDIWSHKQLLKVVSHTPVEVEHMQAVMDSVGWIDVARELIPEPEKLYSWWSYRAKDWRASNKGRRLDHIWVTPALRKAALDGGREAYTIHDEARGWEKASDHAPVTLILDI